MIEDLIGRGWPFPLKPGPDRSLRTVGGAEKVRQSIWLILATAPGERLMLPDFGCGIHDLVFEANTAALRGLVQANVREALLRWEPRIDLIEVEVTSPPGEGQLLQIGIDYRIRGANTIYNLVYPFFLDEGAG